MTRDPPPARPTPPAPRKARAPESPPPERPAPAPGPFLAGLLSGAAAGLLFLGAGYLLYQRLWSGSTGALVGVLAVFGVAGAYGGWLVGVLVFSSTRGDDPG